MIWNLKELMENKSRVEINKNEWIPARPINWKYRSFREKLCEAWMVFTGKTESFRWPGNQ